MTLTVNEDVVRLMVGAFAIWLLLALILVPSARRRLRAAQSGQMPGAAAWLATLSVLKTVASAAVIASAIVVVGANLLEWHLNQISSPDNLGRVVAIRDGAERLVDTVQSTSTEVWLASLAGLALIWLVAACSTSRKRWSEAINARRSAIKASLSDLSHDELRKRAEETDREAVARLQGKFDAAVATNKERIERAMSLPVVRFGGDDGPVASVSDLQDLAAQMRARADEAGTGEKTDSEATDAETLRSTAKGLEEGVAEIKQNLTFEVQTLEGSRQTTLVAALADPDPTAQLSSSLNRLLADIVIEGQLRQHNATGLAKARREPEMLREWIATGATGDVAVRTTSKIGRAGAHLALIAIFLGIVGLTGRDLGSILASKVEALEITLASEIADRDVKSRIEEKIQPDDAAPPAELASDEQTITQLRQAFYSDVGRSLAAGRTTRVGARDLYQLASVEARQRILLASARSAAPSLELGIASSTIEAQIPPPDADGPGFSRVLDEALDHRIQTLRENDGVWHRLKAAAARPAPPDFVAEHFLRTMFATDSFATSHAMQIWAEQASADFASAAAERGNIPRNFHSVRDLPQALTLTSRDRRLIADYESTMPQRVATTLDDIHTGRLDPGSLHRAVPGLAGSGSGRSPASYAEFFPSHPDNFATGSLPDSGPPPAAAPSEGFGGGGRGGKSAKAAPTRVAARSFGRIRFSGRIGGVVIGREPDEGGDEIDVRGFTWSIAGDKLEITLAPAESQPVTIGPFHPAIVHHALAYAADGRVVTATLPLFQTPRPGSNEFFIPSRRVLVHPAFEDTAFACSAIQVDRFVDTFTSTDIGGDTRLKIAQARGAVTGLGSILEQSIRARQPDLTEEEKSAIPENLDKAGEQVSLFARYCGTDDACFPIAAYQKLGFKFGTAQSYLDCLSKADAADQCRVDLPLNDVGMSYLVDSGVREMRFTLDKQFGFLTGYGHESERTWPLDFMIQAVPQDQSGKDVTVGEDWEPWTFPAIDADLRNVVADSVAQVPEAQQILQRMRQFVVLQRLFRVALNGDLGSEFPLDTLTVLQSETAKFVKVQRNEHWNANELFWALLSKLEQGISMELKSFDGDLDATPDCKDFARSALAMAEAAPWPEGASFWPAIGQISTKCSGSRRAEELEDFLQELRRQDLIDEAIFIARNHSERTQFHCDPL